MEHITGSLRSIPSSPYVLCTTIQLRLGFLYRNQFATALYASKILTTSFVFSRHKTKRIRCNSYSKLLIPLTTLQKEFIAKCNFETYYILTASFNVLVNHETNIFDFNKSRPIMIIATCRARPLSAPPYYTLLTKITIAFIQNKETFINPIIIGD